MRISLIDRSLYFKGLVLLVRKDGRVSEPERELILRVGRVFSYEPGFCAQVIDGILTNPHVVDEPPLFSEPEIARCFVVDGRKLALLDGPIHASELRWLKAVAASNSLDPTWCKALLQGAPDPVPAAPRDTLEAERFAWG